ncbi:ABC transporter ATP-binding protein [uncultured Reyranella sp.]|uniref:ABC transporter ATP-binding protein n=1 Tax=uncultured Reyranella sp. TaxID=735512 RepID=UPI0025F942F3|nr:ABC transporter ATP-binding protein [uncultured Reyranella sp.]
MLNDLRAAWRLRSGQAGPGRLAFLSLLIVLAGATDGLGLALLVPLLNSLGATEAGPQGGLLALLPKTLPGLLLVFLGIVLVRALVSRTRLLATARLSFDFAVALRVRAYAAIARASWPYLLRRRTADFHALFSTEIDRVEHATHLLLEVPARLSILAAHFVVAFAIAPGFTALAIAFGTALIWLMRHRLTESRRLGEMASDANMRVSREITEFLQALKLTKAYGAEARHVQAFADAARSAEGADLAANRLQADTGFLLDCLVALALAGFLWAAASWAGLPLADLLVLILVFQRLLPMLQSVQELGQQFVHASPAYRWVASEIEACESAADAPEAATPEPVPFEREIRMEDVHFGYDGQPEILRGVDLSLPAGSLTVLSGISGAGKSTILDLLGGLLTPQSGRILIDGRELTPQIAPAWRQSVGTMAQEAFLFHASIRANLAWARPDASDEAMREAMRLAGLGDFVAALPLGLDTVVGDRGANLSGGERQRLALARLLLRAPRLILLDEPASALDAANEERILETIAGLKGRATIMLVTHRPAAIAAADRHAVLVEGRLA